MQEKEWVRNLRGMSPRARANLRHYLLTQRPRRRDKLAQLLDALEKHVLRKSEGKTPSEEAFAALALPGKPLQYFRQRMHELGQECQKFSMLQHLPEVPADRFRLQLLALRARRWKAAFRKLYGKWRKALPDLPASAERYAAAAGIEAMHMDYLLQAPARTRAQPYAELHASLDIAFLLSKFRFAYSALNYDSLYQSGPEAEAGGHALKGLQPALQMMAEYQQAGDVPPLLQAHYCRLMTLREPENENWFHQLEALLARHTGTDITGGARFSREDAIALYEGAVNYAARRINQGHPEYRSTVIRLYRDRRRKGCLLSMTGEVRYRTIINLVGLLAQDGQYDEADAVIDEYGDKIAFEGENPEKALAFCKGMVRFFRGEFRAVVTIMHQALADPHDLRRKPKARAYWCMALYELGEYEDLRSGAVPNFRKSLHSLRSQDARLKSTYLGFLRDLGALLKVMLQPRYAADAERTDQLTRLRAKIAAQPRIPHNNWLIRQIDRALAE